MSNKTVIYHNPRCSKSRQTLKLLQDNGIEPDVTEYLVSPPDKDELTAILKILGLRPRELMRKKEAEYRALGLNNETLSDEALIAAMVAHPKLIERPIVIRGKRAVIGRPPEAVLDLL